MVYAPPVVARRGRTTRRPTGRAGPLLTGHFRSGNGARGRRFFIVVPVLRGSEPRPTTIASIAALYSFSVDATLAIASFNERRHDEIRIQDSAVAGAVACAVQASAQVTFFEHEGFSGRQFTADQQDRQLRALRLQRPRVVRDRARRLVGGVRGCALQRRVRDAAPRQLRLAGGDRPQRPRVVGASGPAAVQRQRSRFYSPSGYDYRQRKDERLFEADVTSVRAVVGPPEQRCWVERQDVVTGSDNTIPGAIAGAVDRRDPRPPDRQRARSATSPPGWVRSAAPWSAAMSDATTAAADSRVAGRAALRDGRKYPARLLGRDVQLPRHRASRADDVAAGTDDPRERATASRAFDDVSVTKRRPDASGLVRLRRRCYPSSLAHGRSAMNAPATLAEVRPAAARRPEDLVSLDLIRTLVGFDTTSRDSNLALIDWVRAIPRRPRHRVDADVRRRPAQGEPVRHAARARRQRHRRRHRAVGPHRRGAGRRPAVGHRPLRGDDRAATACTAAASPT